tara:strand:- start:8843 stop:9136 length:294 start_codon:yes stop_codon:yes gene_type:complete
MIRYGKTFTDPSSGSSTAVDWNGGTGMFAVQGTFSSATIKLQHKLGSVWQDIGADATLTASGSTLFTTSATQLQVVNSSHTPSVTVVVEPVYENKAL